MKVVIVGAGIAGLACAWHLARSGRFDVTVLEAEFRGFQHASGRNAAIFRPLEEDVALNHLAERSRRLFAELSSETAVLHERDLLLTARNADGLKNLIGAAELSDVTYTLLSAKELAARCAWLSGGAAGAALLLPRAGVIQLDELHTQLLRRTHALGVQLRTSTEVARLLTHGGRVTGVQLQDASVILANQVVLAAGAWSGTLAGSIGVSCPLIPYRRHLAQLELDDALPADLPIVWDVELGVYFREEGAGLLACPGDETPHPAAAPEPDPAALVQLEEKLAKLCPSLGPIRVKHYRACLRTLSPSRAPVLGSDPEVTGLHWLSGLGGHGMSAGLAAGEVVAEQIGATM